MEMPNTFDKRRRINAALGDLGLGVDRTVQQMRRDYPDAALVANNYEIAVFLDGKVNLGKVEELRRIGKSCGWRSLHTTYVIGS